jgi:hypothetical protein
MDTKEKVKLNEKLLLFTGFTEVRISKFYSGQWDGRFTAIFPQNSEIPNERSFTPDLVNDANAQIKWLYPILIKAKLSFAIEYQHENLIYHSWIMDLENISKLYDCDNDSPTLAFALAVEKLIDSMEK